MKRREFFGLWLALAVLATVAGLAYRSVDEDADTLGWLEHTHQVPHGIGEVTGTYARAASARRAYVVAGDASQLSEVAALDARTVRAVAAVRASIPDNPSQIPERRDRAASGPWPHLRTGATHTCILPSHPCI